ncbi:zinc ribbon domain-containing protein [Escherichia coli]|nr:hypothetical protein [Escherichia coli]
MPLNVRRWLCSECGANHDRDINAVRGKPVNLESLSEV